MMRSRSRSRARQSSNYQRSRSRSPFYNRDKPRFEGKPFRGNFQHGRGRPEDRRLRDDYRTTNISPRRSPGHYKPRSRSHSPNPHAQQHSHHMRKGEYNNDLCRNQRSPVHYNSMYRRSPTPQRLTTEPIPKEHSIFRGPEGTLIDLNELKKITVDIRRNLSRGTIPVPHGPLRYAFDPSDVILVRRPGEGSRQIFDREELKPRPAEERVIKLAVDLPDKEFRMEHGRSSSRSRDPFTGTQGPSFQQDGRSVDGDGEGDLRFRLMEKKSSEENKERMNADPNYVPQGRYYYEHDNRERFNNRGRGFVYRGNGRGNYHSNLHQPGGNNGGGGFRGNYRGGNGGHFRESFRGSYRGKLRSPDWQHDLYDTVPVDDGKPSSTTQI